MMVRILFNSNWLPTEFAGSAVFARLWKMAVRPCGRIPFGLFPGGSRFVLCGDRAFPVDLLPWYLDPIGKCVRDFVVVSSILNSAVIHKKGLCNRESARGLCSSKVHGTISW